MFYGEFFILRNIDKIEIIFIDKDPLFIYLMLDN